MSRVFWWLDAALACGTMIFLGVALAVEGLDWQAILCAGTGAYVLAQKRVERLAYQAGWARGVYDSHDLATLGSRQPEPWDPPPAPPPGWSIDDQSGP